MSREEFDPILAEAVTSLAAIRAERGDLSINPDDEGFEQNDRFMHDLFARFSDVDYESVKHVAQHVADNQCAKLEVAILQGEVPKQILWQLIASAWIDGGVTMLAYARTHADRALEQAIADAGELDDEDNPEEEGPNE